MSDVADEGRDAAIERCGKQPKRNCFFTYYVLLPLVPAVAVRESERANPGVPVVLRVSRRILGVQSSLGSFRQTGYKRSNANIFTGTRFLRGVVVAECAETMLNSNKKRPARVSAFHYRKAN